MKEKFEQRQTIENKEIPRFVVIEKHWKGGGPRTHIYMLSPGGEIKLLEGKGEYDDNEILSSLRKEPDESGVLYRDESKNSWTIAREMTGEEMKGLLEFHEVETADELRDSEIFYYTVSDSKGHVLPGLDGDEMRSMSLNEIKRKFGEDILKKIRQGEGAEVNDGGKYISFLK